MEKKEDVNPEPETVVDYDGNIYNTVTMGTQVWMGENLKTSRLNDGKTIELSGEDWRWQFLDMPRRCWYNNDGVTNKGYSNQGSVAQYKTKYQCRVNGSNLIARDGWDGDNQRLAHLVDSWGDCNIIAGQNNVFLDDINNNVEGGTELAGQLDYTGIIVDDTVREMIVDFERVGVFGNAKQNQAL